MSTPPVSFGDFVAHLNMGDEAGDNTNELNLMLEAATDVVENEVGPLLPREVTSTVHARSGALFLPSWPVLSVDTMTDPAGLPVDVDGVGLGSGLVTLTNARLSSYGAYTVTYTAGWDPVPAALRLAVLIVAKHLWETQRPSGGSVPGRFGAEQFEVTQVSGKGFAIPNRAMELMAPYMQPSVA